MTPVLLEFLATVTPPADAAQGVSWLETIKSGGPVGALILLLSLGAVTLTIVHFVQIRRSALLPEMQQEELDRLLANGDVNGALAYCLNPDNDSYATRILSSGLTRYQKSAFGAFEFKNAIEEAMEEQTARLYRSTDALGVIGHIAPLMGLLGTVLGMIGAFEALSTSASSDHEALAANISLALVTTLMGLILAIPCVSLFTYFRNRIDALGAEVAQEIERLTLHLESAGPTPQRPGGQRTAAPAPVPSPARRG